MSTGSMAEDQFTFSRFAQEKFYDDVNQRLVVLARLVSGQHVAELGSGTGAVTKLIVQDIANGDAEVIAIEPSETAIEIARRNLADIRGVVVRFIQGSAEMVSQLVNPKSVDAMFFCNAIHLVSEKEQVLRDIRQTLREGGTFSFNTSFYAGAEPPETEPFYRKWMMRSLRFLKKEYGLSPDKTRVEARHRLTEDEYVQLLKANGFKIRDKEIVQVQMPLSGFEAISEYSLWIEGVLPGVPLAVGAQALKEGARQAFEELGITTSPRNWLMVVAQKV